MTREEAIKIINDECEHIKQHLTEKGKAEEFYIELGNMVIAFNMAIQALEKEPIFSRILEKTYSDFCNCDGGEGWLKIDGKEYVTDTGYAIEGVKIFMEIFKRRLEESEG